MNKKMAMLIILICSIINLQSQTTQKPYDLAMDMKYKKGEVIVKFKDDAAISLLKSGGLMKTGNPGIDALSKKWAISGMKNVFNNISRLKSAQFITLPDGTQKQLSQLYNIYNLSFPEDQDAEKIVADFKALAEVEYAELNGVAYIHNLIPASPILNEKEIQLKAAQTGDIENPNDPLAGQQWYLAAIKANLLWSTTTGDTSQIIGILDTGVDWQHPDLKNKIWCNYNEIPDNGIDDDDNGFIDDVRGWDFVNKDNNPKDDNSHGTHCAGIAAAETHNGIGISGVSWGAKIMPIKVFQSNGIGYFSQIAEGFWYAAKNGCTVFSNSWSSGGESITIRLAMEYAYSKGLIVAAAGNMNTKTDLPCPPWPPYEPNFPACYNWVLGVEATDEAGNNAWFSNFDPTGPVISDGRPYGSIYFNDHDYNYEMRAPGISFMSTVPNGQYRSYSGTSMACPLVAGSIALMKSFNPNLSNEEVFAKLIQPIKLSKMQAGVLDILKCTTTNPPSELYYIKNEITDTEQGDDQDGRPDAGETIDMRVMLKNAGGFGDSIYAKLQFSELEDRSVAQILDSTCYLGSISAYATKKSVDAIKIKIDSNVVDARIISFQLKIWQKGAIDTIYQNLTLKVEHGIEIKGSYVGLLHLKEDAYYLVTEPAVIDSLVIDPGVTLRFKNQMFLMINKYISAIGSPDNRITFKGADDATVKGIIINSTAKSVFDYCIFEDGAGGYTDQAYLVNPQKIYNSIFRFNNYKKPFDLNSGMDVQYNVFTENSFDGYGEHNFIMCWSSPDKFKFNIISNNTDNNLSGSAIKFYGGSSDLTNFNNNVFINNEKYSIGTSSWNGWPMGIYHISKQYWGSTDKKNASNQILDFYKLGDRAVLEPDSILNSPPAEAHSVTWKVEINDQNPQDVPITIGNGPAKFSVYFNRAMDTNLKPFLTFGVRFPYTQNVAEDSAKWSSDHKIWTAYKTLTKSTGDGENTIRVAYAQDLDHFEIPIERSRFKFVVQAANSQSVNFIATPGIGKVKLEWPVEDSTNILGYNMYRYIMPTPSTFSDTILINNTLITDSLFTDFSVTPGITYHYMFTAIRTDLSESDQSKVVQAIPFDAPNGDANGDLTVNVLDITTIVSYLLNNNPQPFIFEAADLNRDESINVLDIVGVVNRVLGNKSALIATADKVQLYMQNDTLFADIPMAVGGIQMDISGVASMDEISVLNALQGFESGYSAKDGSLRLLYYSLSGKTLAVGKRIPLLKLQKGTGITNIIFGDKVGSPISVEMLSTGVWNLSDQLDETIASLGQNFPNPLTDQTTIHVQIKEPVDEAVVRIVNMYGQTVETFRLQNPTVGEHLLEWNAGANKGFFAYLLEIRRGKQQFICPVRKMIVR